MSLETLPLYLDSLCCPTGRLRLVHNIAAANGLPVDIFINGQKIAGSVNYKAVTDYYTLPAGKYVIEVKPVGTIIVLSLTIRLKAEQDVTVMAIGSLTNSDYPPKLKAYKDNNECPCKRGRGSLRFIHGDGDVGQDPVDVLADGEVVFCNVMYPDQTKTKPVKKGTYNLTVNVAGTTTQVAGLSLEVKRNKVYTVVATGILGDTAVPLSALVITNGCGDDCDFDCDCDFDW